MGLIFFVRADSDFASKSRASLDFAIGKGY